MKKILIVEDDQFLSNAYRDKFSKTGYGLSFAKNGKEALDVVKTFAPDVIILDLVMPVKDGFATLEELKKDPETKKIPVIVVSNLGQKEDSDRATMLGAKEFIVKTNLTLDELIAKIEMIM